MGDNGERAVAEYKNTLRRGLSPRHREAMRRIAAGQTVPAVAKDLGYTTAHLHKIASSPLFKRELARMQSRLDQINYDAVAELRRIQPDAVEAYRDLINQTDYKQLRFTVAKDLLDRTGVEAPKPSKEVIVTQTYEQKLSEVKASYTVVHNTGESPIEVMGGEELLKDYDKS